MPIERGRSNGTPGPRKADRASESPAPIDLAEATSVCAVCMRPFTPRGGECTCIACLDRTRVRATAVSVGRRGDETMMEASLAISSLALVHVFLIAGLAAAALAIVASHWWRGAFGPFAIVVAWGLLSVAALFAASPVLTPPAHLLFHSRWIAALAPAGALAAAGAFAVQATAQRQLALFAALDAVIVVAAVLFLIGMSSRLARLGAWAGANPADEGLLVQAGPLFAGVFVTGMAFTLTLFFLRVLDWCDGFAAGIATWLLARAGFTAIAVWTATRSHLDAERRERRDRDRLAKRTAGPSR